MIKKIHKWFWTQVGHFSCYLENKSWKELWRHREFRDKFKTDK